MEGQIWKSAMGLLIIFHLFSDTRADDLDNIFTNLNKMVDYYSDQHMHMNLDGIFGLRFLQGQLSMLLDETWSGKLEMDEKILTKITKLHVLSRNISDHSMTSLKDLDEKYFTKLKGLVTRPLLIAKPYRRLDPLHKWERVDRSLVKVMDEDFSDDCMNEMLKVSIGTACQPSQPCLDGMFAAHREEYSITHQLLYMVVAEQMGCTPELNAYLVEKGENGGVTKKQKEFCTNIFYEIQPLLQAEHGIVPEFLQDLFMEQEMVCALLGFMEFLHTDWFTQILNWQRPSGCYGDNMQSTTPLQESQKSYAARLQKQDLKENIFQEKSNYLNRAQSQENYIYRNAKHKIQRPQINEVKSRLHPNQKLSGEQAQNSKLQLVPEQRLRVDRGVGKEQIDAPEWHSKQKMSPEAGEKLAPPAGNMDVVVQDVESPPKLLFRKHNANGTTQGKKSVTAVPLRLRHGPGKVPGHIAMRKLLMEKTLPDGCSSHKTAVAAAVLTQYLRFLLKPGPPHFQLQVALSGFNHLLHGTAGGEASQSLVAQAPHPDRSMGGDGYKVNKDKQDMAKDPDRMDDEGIQIPQHLTMRKQAVGVEEDKVHDKDYVPHDYYDERDERGEVKLGIGAANKWDVNQHDVNQDGVKKKNIGKLVQGEGARQKKSGDEEYAQYIDNGDEDGVPDKKDGVKVEQMNPEEGKLAAFGRGGKVHDDTVVAREERVGPALKRDGDDEDDDDDDGKGKIQEAGKDDDTYYDGDGKDEKIAGGGFQDGDDDDDEEEEDDDDPLAVPKGKHVVFQPRQGEKLVGQGVNVYSEKDRDPIATTNIKAELNTSVGKSYLILLCVMAVLLYVMYRFVRRRRVLIRYKFR